MRCRTRTTPYLIFLVLALLCGFGGGNFASSMANISFFFPKAEKGNALALNAGLGNLGVSVVQFVVPLVDHRRRVRRARRRAAGSDRRPAAQLWLQNAGFVWVPFIVAAAFAAWFGMNDIADAKASFAEQAVIFQRKHNWIMCWLYTGTFGSFIGYSAGFPLLAKTQFPEVNALQFAFLGPLVGALSALGDRLGRPTARRRRASPSGCSCGMIAASSACSTSSASRTSRRLLGLLRDASCCCSSSPASATPRPSR